jgi:hypothetical protein
LTKVRRFHPEEGQVDSVDVAEIPSGGQYPITTADPVYNAPSTSSCGLIEDHQTGDSLESPSQIHPGSSSRRAVRRPALLSRLAIRQVRAS